MKNEKRNKNRRLLDFSKDRKGLITARVSGQPLLRRQNDIGNHTTSSYKRGWELALSNLEKVLD